MFFNSPTVPSAENQLLGLILSDLHEGNFDVVLSVPELDYKHFLNPSNKIIYYIIKDKVVKGKKEFTIIDLHNLLGATPEYKEEQNYIYDLMNFPLGRHHIQKTAYYIIQCYYKAKVGNLGDHISALTKNPNSDLFEVLSKFEDELNKISNTLAKPEANLKSQIDLLLEETKEHFDKSKTKLKFHLEAVNEVLGGLIPAKHYILAARPAQGKTAFALNTAIGALKQGKRVLFISAEMLAQDILRRILKPDGVAESDIIGGKVTIPDFKKMEAKASALLELAEENLYIIDDEVHIDNIAIRAKALHHQKAFDLVIVDYLQLLDSNNSDQYKSVSEISKKLTFLSKALGVPVLSLSQLSRSIEQRQVQIPQLSDLRESGQIEQDASAVLFIHHNPNDFGNPHKKTLFVQKNRMGKKGIVNLKYLGVDYLFTEDKEDYPDF